MRWGAAIVAAGHGTRFGRPKQFIEIAGLPMVGWSIQTFVGMNEIAELVVATEPEAVEPMSALLHRLVPNLPHRAIAGGATRRDSARKALSALTNVCDAAFVHDGARPLVTARDVRAGMNEVRAGRGALLAERVVDTIKRVDPQSHRVLATLERETLWAAQTPQFGTLADLRRAHARALADNEPATDDAMLLERSGVDVVVVASRDPNFKVTLPADIARAEAILAQRSPKAAAG